MGTIKSPPPVLFFASIILHDSGILSDVETALSDRIGPIEERTPLFPFSQSDYYASEMGTGLTRCFVRFRPLLDREALAVVKGTTNGIEKVHSIEGRRSVNIDPGYLALEHVALGTTKGFAHRIYLGQGIYADLTLIYKNGTYRGLPWTYPDYGGAELISLFNGWREHYKRILQCQRA
jgi:hypothetical protein